jgi:hypothetical protein
LALRAAGLLLIGVLRKNIRQAAKNRGKQQAPLPSVIRDIENLRKVHGFIKLADLGDRWVGVLKDPPSDDGQCDGQEDRLENKPAGLVRIEIAKTGLTEGGVRVGWLVLQIDPEGSRG